MKYIYTSQEDNNNQKNLCDDLEENVGVLAAYGNVVKRIPSIEDLPEQSENKEEEEFIEIHNWAVRHEGVERQVFAWGVLHKVSGGGFHAKFLLEKSDKKSVEESNAKSLLEQSDKKSVEESNAKLLRSVTEEIVEIMINESIQAV